MTLTTVGSGNAVEVNMARVLCEVLYKKLTKKIERQVK